MMKIMTKRVLSALLCAAMAITLLAGCGESDEVKESQDASEEQTSATTSDPDATETPDVTDPAATAGDTDPATTDNVPATSEITTSGTTDPTTPEVADDGWVSAVFGGGPFVTQLDSRHRTLDLIRNSGFNTAIVWSVHVHDDGSLWLNDVEVARDGEIVVNKRISEGWKKLKGDGSSITRVELSIGAWGCKDFEAIGAMMKRDGTGRDTMLYKNFKALIDAYDADAINYDDETCYDPAILTQFGEMCVDMGVKVTLCPYNNMNVWVQVKNNLGDAVDRIYVQCYDGGAGNRNQLQTWRDAFGMDVIPGLWAGKSNSFPADLSSYLKQNRRTVTGGFLWLWDEMETVASPNSVSDYADAINKNNKFAK